MKVVGDPGHLLNSYINKEICPVYCLDKIICTVKALSTSTPLKNVLYKTEAFTGFQFYNCIDILY